MTNDNEIVNQITAVIKERNQYRKTLKDIIPICCKKDITSSDGAKILEKIDKVLISNAPLNKK